ncbi:26S proteasome non-ATPase regulatory subunit 1 -like protein A [Capsicum chinense]|nr:26S proteasome non-ATPase regulatory subunit 1 -like protein A [Capsicum chinense]
MDGLLYTMLLNFVYLRLPMDDSVKVCNAPRSHPEMSHGACDPEGPQANSLLIFVPVHCIISEINAETGHKIDTETATVGSSYLTDMPRPTTGGVQPVTPAGRASISCHGDGLSDGPPDRLSLRVQEWDILPQSDGPLDAKALDEYLSHKIKAVYSNDEATEVDPRLAANVERMLDKCIKDGKYQQAIGMAIEYQRLDNVAEVIVRSDNVDATLAYCTPHFLKKTFFPPKFHSNVRSDEFHRVLAVIILKERHIRVYDSIWGRRYSASLSEKQKMAKILPIYLDMSGFFDQKVRTDWSTTEAYLDKIARYKLSIFFKYKDCGLFVTAYVKYLSDGFQVPNNGLDVGLLRKTYAALLWKYGEAKAQKSYASDIKSDFIAPNEEQLVHIE